MLKLKLSNTLVTWWEELTHWKRPWCWERLRAGGEGDDRGWDGWMASLIWWTWVWASSGSWWWTGRPGVHGVAKSRTWLSNWTGLNYVNTALPIHPTLLTPSRYPRETSKLPHIRVGEGDGLSFFQGWRIIGDCHYHAFIKWKFPRRSLMIHLGQYNSLWGSSQEHFWFFSFIIWRDNDLFIIKHCLLLFWTHPL